MSIVGTQDVPMCRVEELDGFDFVGVLTARQSSAMDSDSTDRAGVSFFRRLAILGLTRLRPCRGT